MKYKGMLPLLAAAAAAAASYHGALTLYLYFICILYATTEHSPAGQCRTSLKKVSRTKYEVKCTRTCRGVLYTLYFILYTFILSPAGGCRSAAADTPP